MKIFLLRHAHSVGNEKKVVDSISAKFDYLSKEGEREAKELIPILNKYDFNVIIVSSLKRTIQTIEPYIKTLSKPKITINKLTLERDAGEFTDKPIKSLRNYRKSLNKKEKISLRLKGGESILDVYKRAKKFLNYLKKNFKDETILICGHKNFLMCLEIVLTNKKIENYYSYSPLKNKELRKFKL